MTETILDEVAFAKKPLIFKGKNVFTGPGIAAGYVVMFFASLGALSTFVSIFSDPSQVVKLVIILFFLLLGFIMAFAKEAFILDPIRKAYIKSEFHLFGTAGRWKNLPEIESVKVMPKDYSYYVQDAIAPTMTFKESLYKVMLFVKDAERGIIISYYKEDEALKVAEQLGKVLDVKVEVLS